MIDSTVRTDTARQLLTCGVVAGPLFVALHAVQVLTREGFDLSRHSLSWLSLGGPGWVQIANFTCAGLLMIAFAVGIRRTLHGGPAGTWGPLLVGAYGVGLVGAGVFVVDPCGGFPVGSRPDCLGDMSWHFLAHNTVSMLAFVLLTLAAAVFARRHAVLGDRGRAAYSAATAVVVLALFFWPGYDGITLRLAAATVVMSVWTTSLALHLRTR